MKARTASLLTALSLALHAAPGFADDRTDADHFEATMGFLAARIDHRETGFVPEGDAPALGDTFRQAPYDGLTAFGLRYDARLVLSHVRMTAGLDLPFASLGTVAPRRVDERTVAPRSLSSWGVRFGLGGEYRVGPVAPFVDLLGSIHMATTEVVVDGRARRYEATAFGLSARAGLRVYLRKWFFVTGAGELGLVGPTQWSAELGVGVRAGS